MRKIMFLANLCCALTSAAQSLFPNEARTKTIGQAEVEATYAIDWNVDPEDPEHRRSDVMHVMAGSNLSFCYVEREMKTDISMWQREHAGESRDTKMFYLAQFGNIYTGYPQGKQTVECCLDIAGNYAYTESTPHQKWTLGTDTMTVLNYLCQRATCEFRGRQYEAWYTEQIPMAFGPWKLNGLPGAILAAKSLDGEYDFRATGIVRKSQPIEHWERDYQKTNRKKYQQHELMLLTHWEQFLADYGMEMKVVSFSDEPAKISWANQIEK